MQTTHVPLFIMKSGDDSHLMKDLPTVSGSRCNWNIFPVFIPSRIARYHKLLYIINKVQHSRTSSILCSDLYGKRT